MALPVYLLLVSFVLTVLTLGYGLLLRRTGWFTVNRLLLWLLVLLAGWLPLADLPALQPQFMQGIMHQTVSMLPQGLSHQVPGVLAHPTMPARLQHRPLTAQSTSLGPVLNWLYSIGMLALTLRFGWRLIALRRLVRHSVRRYVRGIWLLENSSVAAPFSFFHYVVLNPTRYTSDELSQILRHETIHCSYWHSIDRLASEVLRIVLWFNPLVWWHGQLVQENLEYQVDRAVLKAGVNPKDYQYSLLTMSLLAQPIHLANSFSRLQLTNRIRMMNRRQSIGVSLGLLALFGLVTSALLLIWPSAQHSLLDTPLSPFAVARGNETYFVIVPTADASDLKSLQQLAHQRKITLEVAPIVLRDNQYRIQQISIGVHPAGRNYASGVSLKAGTPYGKRPISPLGIRCNPATCTVTPVDQTFPFSLRELAQQESAIPAGGRSAGASSRMSQANLQYGLYETYFLADMIESSFYGFRAMLIRIRPDKHLDLYDEAREAVIIWDRHEISRAELRQIRVTEVMKLSVYKGDAAVARLGDERARPGLVVLSKHPNPALAEDYANNRYLYR